MKHRAPTAAAFAQLSALLPRPWSGPEFVSMVGASRRRPILLVPADLGFDAPNGVWLPLPEVDVVGIPSDATGDRLATIIFHEIAHIVLEHKPEHVMTGETLARILAPDLSPAVVARFMGRHSYGRSPEQDAETLATRLLGEIRSQENRPSTTSTFGRLADHLL